MASQEEFDRAFHRKVTELAAEWFAGLAADQHHIQIGGERMTPVRVIVEGRYAGSPTAVRMCEFDMPGESPEDRARRYLSGELEAEK